MTTKLMRAAVLAVPALLIGAPCAVADSSSPAPAPPPIVVSTGGGTGGSSPGSGCVTRSGTVAAPKATSNPFGWAEPDWPGFAAVDTPAPATACSR